MFTSWDMFINNSSYSLTRIIRICENNYTLFFFFMSYLVYCFFINYYLICFYFFIMFYMFYFYYHLLLLLFLSYCFYLQLQYLLKFTSHTFFINYDNFNIPKKQRPPPLLSNESLYYRIYLINDSYSYIFSTK